MTVLISSIAWQYTAVSLILAACVIWMTVTLIKRIRGRKNGKGNDYCSGCALTNACSKKALLRNMKGHEQEVCKKNPTLQMPFNQNDIRISKSES